ncbi:MAG: hypothetical protein HY897_14050 [Deltaproteobacteria bacterium]|nr:hypothetical protein [Deltaproteobacteria bacterium]
MAIRHQTKLVHEVNRVAEVNVDPIETDTGCRPGTLGTTVPQPAARSLFENSISFDGRKTW